jgi:SAM-dependent methyltransferase
MLDWDHNAYYHRLLLGQLPHRCDRVLDIGCGGGSFATRLASRVEHVDAVDRSPAMIELARQRTPDNVNCILADVLTDSLPGTYDAIVSISALHHMPLQDALLRFAALLRPGGVLAVVALPREDLLRELPTEAVAAVGHRLLGAAFAAARSVGSSDWFAKDSSNAAMPVVMDPPLTTREVADQAGAVLHGVRVRRLVFWRYLLRWDKPA